MFRKLFLFIVISLSLITFASAQETTSTSNVSPDTSTTTAPKRPLIFRPNKDQISQVQKILKKKKLYDGDTDGKYNEATRAGIRSFQKDNGLKETGTLNRATLEAFKVELTDKQKLIPASPNSYVSAVGDKTPHATASTTGENAATSSNDTDKPKRTIFRANSDQIKAAQRLLKSRKMYDGDETGKLSDETREGLRKFQDDTGLKVTGTLNAVTLEKMGIELTDKQKADIAASNQD